MEESTAGVYIKVRVVPKSSSNQIEGWEKDEKGNDELKVRVTAAPEKGTANKAVIDILSKSFKVGKSKVVLQHGETSRHKKFLLTGITRKGIEELL